MWNKFLKFNRYFQVIRTDKNGFTIIEILVTMAIFSVVSVIGANFVINGFKATTFNSEQDTAIQNARKAMEIITKEIRGANSSQRGDYPLSIVGNNELEFYSDTDDDEIMERIRYYKTGTNLMRVVTKPDSFNNYVGTGTTTNVAQYLNNATTSVFTYYDNNYVQTNIINNIRLINIKVKINVTPYRAPNDYYLESDVNLRNLKDNL